MSEIRNILGIKYWLDNKQPKIKRGSVFRRIRRILRRIISLTIIFIFLIENISFSNPDIFTPLETGHQRCPSVATPIPSASGGATRQAGDLSLTGFTGKWRLRMRPPEADASFLARPSKGIHLNESSKVGGIDFTPLEKFTSQNKSNISTIEERAKDFLTGFTNIKLNNLNPEVDYHKNLVNKSANGEILSQSFLSNVANEPIYNSSGKVVYAPSVETFVSISPDIDFFPPQNPPLEYETADANLITKDKKPSWLDKFFAIGAAIKDAAVDGYNYLANGISSLPTTIDIAADSAINFASSYFGQIINIAELAVPTVNSMLVSPLLSTLVLLRSTQNKSNISQEEIEQDVKDEKTAEYAINSYHKTAKDSLTDEDKIYLGWIFAPDVSKNNEPAKDSFQIIPVYDQEDPLSSFQEGNEITSYYFSEDEKSQIKVTQIIDLASQTIIEEVCDSQGRSLEKQIIQSTCLTKNTDGNFDVIQTLKNGEQIVLHQKGDYNQESEEIRFSKGNYLDTQERNIGWKNQGGCKKIVSISDGDNLIKYNYQFRNGLEIGVGSDGSLFVYRNGEFVLASPPGSKKEIKVDNKGNIEIADEETISVYNSAGEFIGMDINGQLFTPEDIARIDYLKKIGYLENVNDELKLSASAKKRIDNYGTAEYLYNLAQNKKELDIQEIKYGNFGKEDRSNSPILNTIFDGVSAVTGILGKSADTTGPIKSVNLIIDKDDFSKFEFEPNPDWQMVNIPLLGNVPKKDIIPFHGATAGPEGIYNLNSAEKDAFYQAQQQYYTSGTVHTTLDGKPIDWIGLSEMSGDRRYGYAAFPTYSVTDGVFDVALAVALADNVLGVTAGWDEAAVLGVKQAIKQGTQRGVQRLPKDMLLGGSTFIAADNVISYTLDGELSSLEQNIASFKSGAALQGGLRFAGIGAGTTLKLAGGTKPGIKAANYAQGVSSKYASKSLTHYAPKDANKLTKIKVGSKAIAAKPFIHLDKVGREVMRAGLPQDVAAAKTLSPSLKKIVGFAGVGPIFTTLNIGIESAIEGETTWPGKKEGLSVQQAFITDTASFAKMGTWLPQTIGILSTPHTIVKQGGFFDALSREHSISNLAKSARNPGLAIKSLEEKSIKYSAEKGTKVSLKNWMISSVDSAVFVAGTLSGVQHISQPLLEKIGFSNSQAEFLSHEAAFVSLIFIPGYYAPFAIPKLKRTAVFSEASEKIDSEIKSSSVESKSTDNLRIKKIIISLKNKDENIRADAFDELVLLLKKTEQDCQMSVAEIEKIVNPFKDKDEGYYNAATGLEREPHLLHSYFEAIRKLGKKGNLNQPVLERLEQVFREDAQSFVREQFREIFDTSPGKETENVWVETMLRQGYSRGDVKRDLQGERCLYEDEIDDIARGKYSEEFSQVDWLKETIAATGKSKETILAEIETAKAKLKSDQQKPSYQLAKSLTESFKQLAEKPIMAKAASLFIPLGLGLLYLSSVIAAPALAAMDSPADATLKSVDAKPSVDAAENIKTQEKSPLPSPQMKDSKPEPTSPTAEKYNLQNPDVDSYLDFIAKQITVPWNSVNLASGDEKRNFHFAHASAEEDLESLYKEIINGVIHNEDIQWKLGIFSHNADGTDITRVMRPDPLDETPPVQRYPIIEFEELDGELISRSDWEYKCFDDLNPYEYSSIEHRLGDDKLKVFDSANSVALDDMTEKIVFDWQYLDELNWGWANADDDMVVKETVNYNTQIKETIVFDQPGDEVEPQFGWAEDSDGNRLYEFYWDGFDTTAKRVKHLFYDDGKTAKEIYYEIDDKDDKYEIDNKLFSVSRIGWDAEKQEMSKDKYIYTERVNERNKIGYKIIDNPNNSDIEKAIYNPLIKISDSTNGVRNLEIYSDSENMFLRFAAAMNGEELISTTNIEYTQDGRMIEHTQNIADGKNIVQIFNNPIEKQLLESESKSAEGEVIIWSVGHQAEKGRRYEDTLNCEKGTVQRTTFNGDGDAVYSVAKRYSGSDLSELKEKLKDVEYFDKLPGQEISLSKSFCNSDGNWVKQTLDFEHNLAVLKTTASNGASENSIAKPFISEDIDNLKQMLNDNALSGYDNDVIKQITAAVDGGGHWLEITEDYIKNSQQTNTYNNIISKNFISGKNINLQSGETNPVRKNEHLTLPFLLNNHRISAHREAGFSNGVNWETKAKDEQGNWLTDKQGNPVWVTEFNDNKKQIDILNRIDGNKQSSKILSSDNKIIWDLSSIDQEGRRLIDQKGRYYIWGESPHTGETKKITLASMDIDSPKIKIAISDNLGEQSVSEISDDGYSKINKNLRSRQTETISLAYKNGVGISGTISDRQGDLSHWEIGLDNGKDTINKQNLRSKQKEKITLSYFGGSPERIDYEGSNKLWTVFKQGAHWLGKEIGGEIKPLSKTLLKNNQAEEYEEILFSFQDGPKEEVTHYEWSEQKENFVEIFKSKAKDENGNWLIDFEGRHFDEIESTNGEKQIAAKFWLDSPPEIVETFAPDGKTSLYKQSSYFNENDGKWHCDRTSNDIFQTQENNDLLWFDGLKGNGDIVEQRVDGDVYFDVQREYNDDCNKIKESIVRCDNQDTDVVDYERILGEWEKIDIEFADGTSEKNYFGNGIKTKKEFSNKEFGQINNYVEEFTYQEDKITGKIYETHSPKGDFIGERVYDNLVDKWELESNYEILNWGREEKLEVKHQADGKILEHRHKSGVKIPLLNVIIGEGETLKELDWQNNLISSTDLLTGQKENFHYLQNDNIKGEKVKRALLDWDYMRENLYNSDREKIFNWQTLSTIERAAIGAFMGGVGLLSGMALFNPAFREKLKKIFPETPSRRPIDNIIIALSIFTTPIIFVLNPLWGFGTAIGLTGLFFAISFGRNLSGDVFALLGKDSLAHNNEFKIKQDFLWPKLSRSLTSCHIIGPIYNFLLFSAAFPFANFILSQPSFPLSGEGAYFLAAFSVLVAGKSLFKAAMRGTQFSAKAQALEIPKTAAEEALILSIIYSAFSINPWLYVICSRFVCQALGGAIDIFAPFVVAKKLAPEFRMKLPTEIRVNGVKLRPKKIFKEWIAENEIDVNDKNAFPPILDEIKKSCPVNKNNGNGACSSCNGCSGGEKNTNERWHIAISDLQKGEMMRMKYEEKVNNGEIDSDKYKYLSPEHRQYEFLLYLLAKTGIKEPAEFLGKLLFKYTPFGGGKNGVDTDIWQAIRDESQPSI